MKPWIFPGARSYRSPSMELDYMESELPQTWPWQIATWPICIALSAWILSLRHIASVRIDGTPYRAGPSVYVVWHRYSVLAVALLPPILHPLVALGNTAPHVRALRYTVRLTGTGVVPGSASHRAQEALEQLAQELRNGASVMVVVDGPRGPVYHAKPGCVRLAQAAGVPIVPVALGGRGFSHVRNWDRMLLPWPVNRFAVRFGEAIHPGDDVRATLDRVDRQLHALCASVGMEG
jgi:lysophospholipid acyltransferase (LPLAT)-like uncharacterized protein